MLEFVSYALPRESLPAKFRVPAAIYLRQGRFRPGSTMPSDVVRRNLMFRKLIGLASLTAVAFATGACHSGGTYFSSAERMPQGPGVVDCAWYQKTENSYVRETCATPGPVAVIPIAHATWPRAGRGDPHLGCPGEVLPELVPTGFRDADPRPMHVAVAPEPVRVSRGTASVSPGVTYGEGIVVQSWDDPVPPPRPGAPLPRPTSARGEPMGR